MRRLVCNRSLGIASALLAALAPPVFSQSPIDGEIGQLLVNAVEAAADLDLYNSRCRSDDSGRRTDNLNKELAGKFRMTVLKVQDDLFPEGSYRRVQERLQRDFLERLKRAGGCKEAKKAGMPEELGGRYEQLMREIEALP